MEGRHDDQFSNLEELNATHHPMSTTPHRLGIQLSHSLHIIQCLDALHHLAQSDSADGKDNPASTECIQSLHSLVFSVTGRLSLIHVLSLDSNLDVLVNILTPLENDAEMEVRLKESAVRGYASELVALVVRSTENAAFYAKYGASLHGLVTSASLDAGCSSNNKLSQLVRWMEVLNQPQVFNLDVGLPVLCSVIKQHADDVANFPPEFIVALRLICPLAIPERSQQVETRLKYIFWIFTNLFVNALYSI